MLDFAQRVKFRLCLCRVAFEDFFKEVDFEVGELAVVELVFNGDADHLAFVNRAVNGFEFLDAFSAYDFASEFENQGGACRCVGVGVGNSVGHGTSVGGLKFVEESQVRDFLF